MFSPYDLSRFIILDVSFSQWTVNISKWDPSDSIRTNFNDPRSIRRRGFCVSSSSGYAFVSALKASFKPKPSASDKTGGCKSFTHASMDASRRSHLRSRRQRCRLCWGRRSAHWRTETRFAGKKAPSSPWGCRCKRANACLKQYKKQRGLATWKEELFARSRSEFFLWLEKQVIAMMTTRPLFIVKDSPLFQVAVL